MFRNFSFSIVSDPHLREGRGLEKFLSVIDAINARPEIEFTLLLGDFCWDGPVAELDRLLGRFARPCYFVLGNNDRNREPEYRKHFGPLYYSFESNACLFLGLWNAVLQGDMGDHQGYMDATQVEWVERTLSAAREVPDRYRHVVLFAHVPLRQNWQEPSKYWMVPDLSARWLDWCRRFDIRACLFGHTHYSDDFSINGTDFITTVSTNWNFDSQDLSVNPFWNRQRRETGGFRVVKVGADAISHEFVPLKSATVVSPLEIHVAPHLKHPHGKTRLANPTR